MRRLTIALSLLLLCASVADAQPGPPSPQPSPSFSKGEGAAPPNEVPGLKLPAPFEVKGDAMFVVLRAESPNPVAWLIRGMPGTPPPKVKEDESEIDKQPVNEVTIGIPSEGGVIEVAAVTVVEGKVSKFAVTTITVTKAKSPTQPQPGPGNGNGAGPGPAAYSGAVFVVVLEETAKKTADTVRVLTSQAFLAEVGQNYRVLDVGDQLVKERNLTGIVQQVGAPCLVVIALDGARKGEVLAAVRLPATEQEAISVIKQAKGKQP